MAKAKSARPAWRASVSRISASVRTSIVAPPLARRGVREEAVAAEPRDEVAAGGIDVVMVDMRKILLPPKPRALGASARWRSSKNGQSRKLLVRHAQFPANTGFCLATKAS